METNAAKYARLMRDGNWEACVALEQRHGLCGYPPELVTLGLRAIDDGRSAEDAINAYLAGESA